MREHKGEENGSVYRKVTNNKCQQGWRFIERGARVKFLTQRVTGLDIGATGVRAVEITPSKKGSPILHKIAETPLDPGIVINGELRDADRLTDAVRRLFSDHKLSQRVVFGLSGSGVIVRQMDVDWVPDKQFDKSLRFQIADKITMPLNEANLGYHALRNGDDPVNPTITLLLAAAGKGNIEKFTEALSNSGAQPRKADITPFALIRAHQTEIDPNAGVEAIVNIGGDLSNIVIHQGGNLLLTRTLQNMGGNIITKAIMDHFKLVYLEADALKRDTGLGRSGGVTATSNGVGENAFGITGATTNPTAGGGGQHPAVPVIAARVSTIIGEIRNSLDYFQRSYPGVELTTVHLSGGVTQMEGLPERMEAELRMKVLLSDPFLRLSVQGDISNGTHDYTVAAGLALGM
jgi:type IV pilus assembly protein PilM